MERSEAYYRAQPRSTRLPRSSDGFRQIGHPKNSPPAPAKPSANAHLWVSSPH